MLTGRLIETTTKAAMLTPGIKRYKLAASLIDKGRIVCVKGNSRKTHPLQLKHSPYPYLHAESHCIIGHGLDNCSGLDLLVVRVVSNGKLTMAAPCEHCLNLCRKVGLANVYYSDWKGNIECLKLL